jgi:hypothetical protein
MIRSRTEPWLSAVLAGPFVGERLAEELVREFLDRPSYDRDFAGRLVAVAGARGCAPSWPVRRLAVLMLEAQLLALPAGDAGEWGRVLRAIAADPASGLEFPPGRSVLDEGYSTAAWPGFTAELRARMGRHERIHRRLRGAERDPDALVDFLDLSRQECKLTLARYLFHPDEVVERIGDQVRTSGGLLVRPDTDLIRAEAEHLLELLPAYERAIVAGLAAGSQIFWVDDATDSRLNSLVEYPLGTVVLVVKPPGSCLEFEIKRAGRRGPNPLSVVHDRSDEPVPPTHRLDGGSMAGSLRTESSGAALMARLFRLVHGQEAPISRTVALHSIHEVPCAFGRVQVLDYFTDPDTFGEGHAAMRQAIGRSIESFGREWEVEPLDVPGDLGTTVAFLSQVSPAQSLLVGTTSFRLELLSAYLSDEGPDLYFRRGLGVEPSEEEVRRFRQTLLDEALGGLAAAEVEPRDRESFVDALLAVPENRRRADAVYLDLTAQIGRFWGSAFGLKFYSNGESFVGRNVGLRSVWEGGRWRVRVVFMDHDILTVDLDAYRPKKVVAGCWLDALYIFGNLAGRRRGELDHLAAIYRVDPTLAGRGRASLLAAARDSFRTARERLSHDPEVRAFFDPLVLKRTLDWDSAAAAYLRARRRGLEVAEARDEGAEVLEFRGHPPDVITTYMEAVVECAGFLEGIAELFEADPDGPPRDDDGRRVG